MIQDPDLYMNMKDAGILDIVFEVYKNADEMTPDDEGIHITNTLKAAEEALYVIKVEDTEISFTTEMKKELSQGLSTLLKEECGVKNPEILVKNILENGSIEDYEVAQLISKIGYALLNQNADICSLGDVTEANHPEEFKKARVFGEHMNIDLDGHDDITTGLAAFEIVAEEIISRNLNSDPIESAGPATDEVHECEENADSLKINTLKIPGG